MTHGRAHLNEPSLPAGLLATDRQADTRTHTATHVGVRASQAPTRREQPSLGWGSVVSGRAWDLWSVGPAFSRPHLVCAGPTPPSLQCHPMRAKAERIQGAKSQTDGNAMVIIELRTGGVRNHEKGRLPAAPGQQKEGLSPQGTQRREPEGWGGSPAPATESPSAGSRGEVGHARVGCIRRSRRRSCPRSVWRKGRHLAVFSGPGRPTHAQGCAAVTSKRNSGSHLQVTHCASQLPGH